MIQNLLNIIKNFKDRKVLVIGDVMLDRYISGEVSRISPEAPVPIVKAFGERAVPGGAANAACNVVALGGTCHLIGLVGDDPAGVVLKKELYERGINPSGLFIHDSPTVQKIRIISTSKQQLLRLDYEKLGENKKELEIIEHIRSIIKEVDVVAISDYAEGMITPAIAKELLSHGKRVLVDPRPANIDLYYGVYLIKPSRLDTETITGIKADSEENLVRIGNNLLTRCKANILVTRGKDGMSLFELSGSVSHIPTEAKEVYDVTGAGDTAFITLALALESGAGIKEATILANYSAGIKIGKAGTATVSAKELSEFLGKKKNKVASKDEIRDIVKELKNKGKKIVFTNGCFDILHVGHTKLLKRAKELGDILILGLDTDNSVRKIKGSSRPIISQDERAEILSALECIDHIIFFEEGDPLGLIRLVQPDVLVKGDDYNDKVVVGREFVESNGGKVELIPLVEGVSTTSILDKVKKENADTKNKV